MYKESMAEVPAELRKAVGRSRLSRCWKWFLAEGAPLVVSRSFDGLIVMVRPG